MNIWKKKLGKKKIWWGMKNDNLILNFADLMQILNSQPDQQEKKFKINVANMARETPKLYM